MHKRSYRNIVAAAGSPKVFWGLVGFLVFEALWIALTGHYPMAFDEDFHLGIVQIYAEQWSPFLAAQPANADVYGAVVRDPSYLYHYLMSLPYRFMGLFTDNQTVQVIMLRGINIALFAASLPLYRLLLQAVGASRALVNAVLACFVLIPVVPLLAAQINYDNLLMSFVAAALLLAIRFVQQLQTTGRISVRLAGALLVVCLLASLVQYEFLPIFLTIVGFIGVVTFGKLRGDFSKVWRGVRREFVALKPGSRWLLGIAVAVSLLLFAQRYGLNVVQYRTPLPDCSAVLSVERCMAYPPWARNYRYMQQKAADAPHSPVTFNAEWLEGMWVRSFFAVDGPRTDFQTRGPLPVPAITAIIVVSVGMVLMFAYRKRIFDRRHGMALALLLVVGVGYIGMLWFNNYQGFLATGQPVAINGRYLVPLFLPLILLLGLGYAVALRRWPVVKVGVATAAVVCMLWGGGWLTYVLRSNPGWYWPSQTVFDANTTVQRLLGPLVPGTDEPTKFL